MGWERCVDTYDNNPTLRRRKVANTGDKNVSLDAIGNNPAQAEQSSGVLPQNMRSVIAFGQDQANVSKVNIKKDKDLAEAEQIISDVFPDGLYCFNQDFYGYSDGIWAVLTRDEITHHLALHYYKSSYSIQMVNKWINALSIIAFVKTFPTCQFGEVVVLQNCAINLNSSTQLAHSPEHYAKNKLSFNYDENAACPIWLKFLQNIWEQDQDYSEKVALLQEYMGLSLTTMTQYQKMLWLIGEGSNGKGVIFDIVKELVGSNNYSSVAFAEFGQKFSLEQLENKLVNIDPDMSRKALLAPSVDAKIKAIVGGDNVTLERKNKNAFQTKLVAKLWAGTNCLPKTEDQSHGFFRRVLILKFNRVITESEKDIFLIDKLKPELPGIFNWALEGLKRLQHNRTFTLPASSRQEVENYKMDNNPVELFHNQYLKKVDVEGSPSKNGILIKHVYEAFKSFCKEQNLDVVNQPEFGKRLAALGIKSSKSNGQNYYPVEIYGPDANDDKSTLVQIQSPRVKRPNYSSIGIYTK